MWPRGRWWASTALGAGYTLFSRRSRSWWRSLTWVTWWSHPVSWVSWHAARWYSPQAPPFPFVPVLGFFGFGVVFEGVGVFVGVVVRDAGVLVVVERLHEGGGR